MVILENLKKYYGSVCGCEDVSFTVKPGEIFAFIGPNGAGKSTTINCIMGLIKNTDGQVTVLGEDAFSHGHMVRNKVGFMPSEFSAPENLTARKFLDFVCKSKGAPNARVEEFAKRLELPLNRKIKTLSHGNKRKVEIIAAVCTNPEVIIFDEPTNGLDPIMQKVFFEIIKEQASMGASIIFSTHILSDVKKVCNKIGIIKNGKIISVEESDSFIEKQIKDVVIELEYGTMDAKSLKLSGIKNFKADKTNITFDYNGSIKELVKVLNSYPIINLTIKDVDAESLFLRYYN